MVCQAVLTGFGEECKNNPSLQLRSPEECRIPTDPPFLSAQLKQHIHLEELAFQSAYQQKSVSDLAAAFPNGMIVSFHVATWSDTQKHTDEDRYQEQIFTWLCPVAP